jgi:hypothetical protein
VGSKFFRRLLPLAILLNDSCGFIRKMKK